VAGTAAGERLTERQRQAQIAIRARVLTEFIDLWPLLDPLRLAVTAPGWIAAVLAMIQRHKPESALTAADYYRAYRAAETGELVPPKIALINTINTERARTGLIVTGPVRLKQLGLAGADPEQATDAALQLAAGAAAREVLAGGRDTIQAAVAQDRVALGFARVTDADPCHFCALLASRGPAYKTEESATHRKDGQPYHTGCACTAEPVYRRDAPWPGQAKEWRALYYSATAGLSGKDAVRAFRRAYEGRAARPAAVPAGAPEVPASAVRRRTVEAEIGALERTFRALQARKDRGEDPGKPYDWQKSRLASLRAELADLPSG
jgi:hypothetical protein